MVRLKEAQTYHDKCVEKIAKENLRSKNVVKADLPGWDKPPEINGFIPDVYVYYVTTNIMEVETEDTIDSDIEQHKAFIKYAEENELTWFSLYLASDDGKCSMRDFWPGHNK